MKTYVFADKNTSITVTISAENEEEARAEISDFMERSESNRLRLDYLEDEEEDEEENSIAFDEGIVYRKSI